MPKDAKAAGLEGVEVLLYAPFASSEVLPLKASRKLPPEPASGPLLTLFAGINLVGVWDELFFINTCFALLRSLFPFWSANLAQSVVYTSVLYGMAFQGWGPLFVFFLALTQGVMFERSRMLVYVLVVHLIVDYFLFQEIVEAYYPALSVWWHP